MDNVFRRPRFRKACENAAWNHQALAAIEIGREATTEVLAGARTKHRIAIAGLAELDVNEPIEQRLAVHRRGRTPPASGANEAGCHEAGDQKRSRCG